MASINRRNIVIVGKAGTGKATIANQISGAITFDVLDRRLMSRSAREIVSKRLSVDGCEIKLSIIDTAGLNGFPNKTNLQILEDIRQQSSEGGINLILFVVSHSDGFTQEDRQPTEFIISHLHESMSTISALVVTKCENQNDQKRAAIIKDYKDNAQSITNFMGKGILTFGFPKPEDIDDEFKPIIDQRVQQDKQKLHDLVYSSDQFQQLQFARVQYIKSQVVDFAERRLGWQCIIL